MFRIVTLSGLAVLAAAMPSYGQFQWVRGPGGYQVVPQTYYYVQPQRTAPPVVDYTQLPVGSYPTGQEQVYSSGKYVLFTTPYNQQFWVWYPATQVVPTNPYPYQVPYQPYQPAYPQIPGNARPPFGGPGGGPGGVLPDPNQVGSQKPVGTAEAAPQPKPSGGQSRQ